MISKSKWITWVPKLDTEKIWDGTPERRLIIPTPQDSYPLEITDFALGCYGLSAGRRHDDVRCVAGELGANAIEHGNGRDPEKNIELYAGWKRSLGRTVFYLAVRDEGLGFDVDFPPFVHGRSGVPPEGGLGIPFVRARADRLYSVDTSVVAAFIEPSV